jgi:hypothetical protein
MQWHAQWTSCNDYDTTSKHYVSETGFIPPTDRNEGQTLRGVNYKEQLFAVYGDQRNEKRKKCEKFF